MARSTYIYIAYDPQTDHIIVVGTVKYEVMNYIKKHAPDCRKVRRYRDGRDADDWAYVDVEHSRSDSDE